MKVVLLVLVAGASLARADVDWSDKPAWPDTVKEKRILLLWDVGSPRKDPKAPDNGQLLRGVDVVMSLGNVTRRIKLKPESGALYTYNQIICKTSAYPLESKEVAKLTFYEGGASGYAVARPSPDVLEIHHWTQSDGACPGPKGEPTVCPGTDQLVARLHIPQDVKVGGGAIFVTDDGKQTKVSCDERE